MALSQDLDDQLPRMWKGMGSGPVGEAWGGELEGVVGPCSTTVVCLPIGEQGIAAALSQPQYLVNRGPGEKKFAKLAGFMGIMNNIQKQ